jgi:hypothetical protein
MVLSSETSVYHGDAKLGRYIGDLEACQIAVHAAKQEIRARDLLKSNVRNLLVDSPPVCVWKESSGGIPQGVSLASTDGLLAPKQKRSR